VLEVVSAVRGGGQWRWGSRIHGEGGRRCACGTLGGRGVGTDVRGVGGDRDDDGFVSLLR